MEAVFTGPDGQLVQQRWDQAAAAVRWEDQPPVAPFPVVPGRSWGPGWWWSATTGGHVMHGSVAMRTQLMVLDRDPGVTWLAARPVRLVWRDPGDGRPRSWVPQLFARCVDGSGLLADCPAAADAGGIRALRAAQIVDAACTAVGWSYRRLALPGAVVAANLRWLAGYRHPRNAGTPGLAASVQEVFAEPRPLEEGAAACGDPIAVLPAVFHALWAGRLDVALDQPLHHRSLVGPGKTAQTSEQERGQEREHNAR
nr:TnsA-like heteromeric transposase endonuclease subunit [Streptomyces sp. SN-593]